MGFVDEVLLWSIRKWSWYCGFIYSIVEHVGSLLRASLEEWVIPPEASLPDPSQWNGKTCTHFLSIVENYGDDCINFNLVQTKDIAVLRHVAQAALFGIHSVFPPLRIYGHSGEDTIAMDTPIAGNGIWDLQKEFRIWIMNRATRYIELTEKRQEQLLGGLNTVLRLKSAVPFKQLERSWANYAMRRLEFQVEIIVSSPSILYWHKNQIKCFWIDTRRHSERWRTGNI